MFERPRILMTAVIMGIFSGTLTGLGVYLFGFEGCFTAGALAFLVVCSGILSFAYANELYTHVVEHQAMRANSRKERAKSVSLAQKWVDWDGNASLSGDEIEPEGDDLVILTRSIPVNDGTTLQSEKTIPAVEWQKRKRAMEFFKWAKALKSVTSTAMVPKALNNATDWSEMTTILMVAGLLVKRNGQPTQLVMDPGQAIEQIREGKVALSGRVPNVNLCPPHPAPAPEVGEAGD